MERGRGISVSRPLTIGRHAGFTGSDKVLRVIEPLRSSDSEPQKRRASRRVRVTCAATLQTMTTLTHGILGDISESGARFEADEPPGKGATAVLKWGAHEAVCTIIWHDDGACGLWFKQKLPADLVAETAAIDRVVEMPIASVGSISPGRRRSRGFLKRAETSGGQALPVAAEIPRTERAFGRAGGLASQLGSGQVTLAEVLRRYRHPRAGAD